MTNAEKYLKDKNYTKDFISDYMIYCVRKKQDSVNLESLSLFFREEAKPTLTEDERVILRNMQPEKTKKVTAFKIKRGKDGDLWLFTKGTLTDVTYQGNEVNGETNTPIIFYNHLFQFIKERRRILY